MVRDADLAPRPGLVDLVMDAFAAGVWVGVVTNGARSWAEPSYPTLSYFGEAERGGHFAAWEEPELFAAELRAAFRQLR